MYYLLHHGNEQSSGEVTRIAREKDALASDLATTSEDLRTANENSRTLDATLRQTDSRLTKTMTERDNLESRLHDKESQIHKLQMQLLESRERERESAAAAAAAAPPDLLAERRSANIAPSTMKELEKIVSLDAAKQMILKQGEVINLFAYDYEVAGQGAIKEKMEERAKQMRLLLAREVQELQGAGEDAAVVENFRRMREQKIILGPGGLKSRVAICFLLVSAVGCNGAARPANCRMKAKTALAPSAAALALALSRHFYLAT